MIDLIIEEEALSANDPIYGVNKQGSRHLYKNKRTHLIERLQAKIGEGAAEDRKAFKFVRHWGPRKRQFDEANLIGGFKILVDAMNKLNHIVDDNPDYFKGYYQQKKSQNGMGYIEIKELDPIAELETQCELMSEYMQMDEETLLKAARKTKLVR